MQKAPRNRTLTLSADEREQFRLQLKQLDGPVQLSTILDCTILGDTLTVLSWLPTESVDLLIIDPPYNLTKAFNGTIFRARSDHAYEEWFESWLPQILPILKPTASVYVCSDWRSSAAVHRVLARHLVVRNRITWEREKGRGARRNWKNASEDIWFCTVSDDYTFNVEDVKLKRRVIAPYTDGDGQPKDWDDEDTGRFRLTFPSNLWTDLTVPFWSMPENTDHPTQKPEKLLAKIILASSNVGDVVLDPFLGSGTTSVVAKKLDRHYIGIEVDETYCSYAEKRLSMASTDRAVQGYKDGVFWERNARIDRI